MSGQLPAARINDPTTHGTPALPGPGSPTVVIDGRPAWRAMIDTHLCPAPGTPHGPEKIYLGSTTVLINGQMACRLADILQGLGPPNGVEMGCPTVCIGDNGFGMGREEIKNAFIDAGRELLNDWEDLGPEERLARIETALNASFPPGMPLIIVAENPLFPTDHLGQFSFNDWAVEINSEILSGEMDEVRMARLMNTAYHEGRHAEQWWNAAQYRAAEGDSSDRIARRMQVPDEIADAAIDRPAESGTSESVMGKTVFASVYGSRSTYRHDVLTNLEDPDRYPQYRALPEEEDAWRHGDDIFVLFRMTR